MGRGNQPANLLYGRSRSRNHLTPSQAQAQADLERALRNWEEDEDYRGLVEYCRNYKYPDADPRFTAAHKTIAQQIAAGLKQLPDPAYEAEYRPLVDASLILLKSTRHKDFQGALVYPHLLQNYLLFELTQGRTRIALQASLEKLMEASGAVQNNYPLTAKNSYRRHLIAANQAQAKTLCGAKLSPEERYQSFPLSIARQIKAECSKCLDLLDDDPTAALHHQETPEEQYQYLAETLVPDMVSSLSSTWGLSKSRLDSLQEAACTATAELIQLNPTMQGISMAELSNYLQGNSSTLPKGIPALSTEQVLF